ncbi:Flagellar basal-body rod protein FlgF [Pigmentiphaga humi]|uniref:Flagellar basal-body rod protein FlgF n=1 Tax=Pigmentiphaga humi TaxID=2478468 RepID=A0A3P4B1G7_9BURK|nr:flagellar basal-body rod protein FlgF [Pigmentiphaga humi]VCU69902.1 Flagellar basal-body rod protein FlgF [Pigmentiphaga humi]
MDRALYIAATGARELMRRQDIQTNNLANALTPGFRAEIAAQRTAPVVGGAGLRTRAYAVESTPGADMSRGPMMATGRELDVAVQGDGWFAVRTADGSEAYTRSGSFQLSPEGTLVDTEGRQVLDANGEAIMLPLDAKVQVNTDGSISTVSDVDRVLAAQIGNLKLVNPPANSLERGADGLFRLRQGGIAPADADVRVAGGMLEGSNVNAVDTMVGMIAAARHYDVQIQLMQSTDKNQQAATQLLSVG